MICIYTGNRFGFWCVAFVVYFICLLLLERSEDDVSSTKVRTIMENVKSNNPKEGLEKLKGLLEQVVIDYMEENWKDLFQQTK
jgi:hypothetical protein